MPSSIPRDWKQAMADIVGPANALQHVPNSSVSAASGEGIISALPARLLGISYTITATNAAIDVRYYNSSAIGLGGPPGPLLFGFKQFTAGTDTIWFKKPLFGDHGLVWLTSATGAASPQVTVHWESAPNTTLGLR